jgi:hypothetical protein
MKLKYLILLIFIFGLTACPTPVDTDVNVESFKINGVVITKSAPYEYSDIQLNKAIDWDKFTINFDFETKTETKSIAALLSITNKAYATYDGVRVSPEIENIRIWSNNDYNKTYPLGTELYNLFSAWNCETEVETRLEGLLNTMIYWTHQSKGGGWDLCKGHITLKESPIDDFKGKFYVELEFEDGSVLLDSTQTVTITEK